MYQDLGPKETIGPAWLQDLAHGWRHHGQDAENLCDNRQPENEAVPLKILLFGQEDGKAEGCG
jgi:hypothetical protein